MFVDHPYVHDTNIVQNAQPDGTSERVLVIKTRLGWNSGYSVSNDNRLLMELSEQVRRLERLASVGMMEFDRVDIIPAD